MGSVALAADLETVTVGDVQNDADDSGYGAVDHEYDIGKYEVTAGQYTEFLNAVAGVDTYGLYNASMWSSDQGCKIERYAGAGTEGDPYQYQVAGDKANRPVNYVSWGDAARFANWLHNGQPGLDVPAAQDGSSTEDGAYFLDGATSDADLVTIAREADWLWAIPTEDEWYKAAYFDATNDVYYEYPTGSDDEPSHELIDPDPGNNATMADETYNLATVGAPHYRTEVGAHENSASPYGTFDQGGNVWEWTEAVPYATVNWRGVRGGAYNQRHFYLKTTWGEARSADTEDAVTGFRVVQVPEPGVTVLLAMGGVTLLRRRRNAMR
jgi:formylglycine-generating enzyme required for sulfatase activity